MLERRALGFADQERLPTDIGPAQQPEGDHAGADRMIGEAVDDDERAGLPVRLIGSKATGTEVVKLQNPMSLRPSVCTARCSGVFTSILYLRVVIETGRVLVPMRGGPETAAPRSSR
jgi:hypothetical protein